MERDQITINKETAELMYLIQGLGSASDDNSNNFTSGPRILSSLKALEYLLRRDEPEKQPSFIKLGQWETMKTHLLPLLITYRNDRTIIYCVIRILVRLTMPLKSITENKLLRITQFQQYKQWLINNDVLAVLQQWFVPILSQFNSDRNEEDKNLFELILALIKNILLIPDPIQINNQQDLFTINIHDRMIIAYYNESIIETLLLLTQNIEQEKNYNLILLECWAQLFRNEQPEELTKHLTELQQIQQKLNKNNKNNNDNSTNNNEDMDDQYTINSLQDQLTALRDRESFLQHSIAESTNNSEFNNQLKELKQEINNVKIQINQLQDKQTHKSSNAHKPSNNNKNASSLPVVTEAELEKQRLLNNILALKRQENAELYELNRACGVRHGRFGSRIVERDPLKPGSQLVIKNLYRHQNTNALPNDVQATRTGKKPINDVKKRVYLNSNVRKILYETCVELIDSGAFNKLITSIQPELGSLRSSADDDLNFMKLCEIVMGIHRLKQKPDIQTAIDAINIINKQELDKWKQIKSVKEAEYYKIKNKQKLKREEKEALVEEENNIELEEEQTLFNNEMARYQEVKTRIEHKLQQIKDIRDDKKAQEEIFGLFNNNNKQNNDNQQHQTNNPVDNSTANNSSNEISNPNLNNDHNDVAMDNLTNDNTTTIPVYTPTDESLQINASDSQQPTQLLNPDENNKSSDEDNMDTTTDNNSSNEHKAETSHNHDATTNNNTDTPTTIDPTVEEEQLLYRELTSNTLQHEQFLSEHNDRQRTRLAKLKQQQIEHNNALINENIPFDTSVLPPLVIHSPSIQFTCDNINAILTIDGYKYLNKKISTYLDDKPTPVQSLHIAINMYKEIIHTLYEMYEYGNDNSRKLSEFLRKNIFYDKQSLELFTDLIKQFNPTKFSKTYLCDLIICVHYSMKLLQSAIKKGEKIIVVEKRKRVIRKKKEKPVDDNEPVVAGVLIDGNCIIPAIEIMNIEKKQELELELQRKRTEATQLQSLILSQLSLQQQLNHINNNKLHINQQIETEQHYYNLLIQQYNLYLTHPLINEQQKLIIHNSLNEINYNLTIKLNHFNSLLTQLTNIEQNIMQQMNNNMININKQTDQLTNNSNSNNNNSHSSNNNTVENQPGLAVENSSSNSNNTPITNKIVSMATATPSPGSIAYNNRMNIDDTNNNGDNNNNNTNNSTSLGGATNDTQLSMQVAKETQSTMESDNTSLQPQIQSQMPDNHQEIRKEHSSTNNQPLQPSESTIATSNSPAPPFIEPNINTEPNVDKANEINENNRTSELQNDNAMSTDLSGLADMEDASLEESEKEKEKEKAARLQAEYEAKLLIEKQELEAKQQKAHQLKKQLKQQEIEQKKAIAAAEAETKNDNTDNMDTNNEGKEGVKTEEEYEDIEIEEEVRGTAAIDAETGRAEYIRKETEFDFTRYLLRYAHASILKNYCWLLNDYKINDKQINNYIIRLFERLAYDRDLAAMFFQLEVFILFDKILQDKTIKTNKTYDNMRALCKYVMKQFFDRSKQNPILFAEVLFWKNFHIADGIMNNYTEIKQQYQEDKEFYQLNEIEQNDNQDWIPENDNNLNEQDINIFDPYNLQQRQADEDAANNINTNSNSNSNDDPTESKSNVNTKLMGEARRKAENSDDEAELEVEAYEQDEDLDLTGKKVKKKNKGWTSEEDKELTDRYEEYAELGSSLADVLSTLITNRTPEEITKRIKQLKLKRLRKQKLKAERKAERLAAKKAKINVDGDSEVEDSPVSESEPDSDNNHDDNSDSNNNNNNTNNEQRKSATPKQAKKSNNTKLPDIRDLTKQYSLIFVDMVRDACTSTCDQFIYHLDECKDLRGMRGNSMIEYEFKPNEWEGLNKSEKSLNYMKKLIEIVNLEINDSDDTNNSWFVPAHYNARFLENLVVMLRKTLRQAIDKVDNNDNNDTNIELNQESNDNSDNNNDDNNETESSIQKEEIEEESKEPVNTEVENESEPEADPEIIDSDPFIESITKSIRIILTSTVDESTLTSKAIITQLSELPEHADQLEQIKENKSRIKEVIGQEFQRFITKKQAQAEKARLKAEEAEKKAKKEAARKAREEADAKLAAEKAIRREARERAKAELAAVSALALEERRTRKRKEQAEKQQKEEEKKIIRVEDELDNADLAAFMRAKRAKLFQNKDKFTNDNSPIKSSQAKSTNSPLPSQSQSNSNKVAVRGRLRRLRNDDSDQENNENNNNNNTQINDSMNDEPDLNVSANVNVEGHQNNIVDTQANTEQQSFVDDENPPNYDTNLTDGDGEGEDMIVNTQSHAKSTSNNKRQRRLTKIVDSDNEDDNNDDNIDYSQLQSK